jgi:hypothetical protein
MDEINIIRHFVKYAIEKEREMIRIMEYSPSTFKKRVERLSISLDNSMYYGNIDSDDNNVWKDIKESLKDLDNEAEAKRWDLEISN